MVTAKTSLFVDKFHHNQYNIQTKIKFNGSEVILCPKMKNKTGLKNQFLMNREVFSIIC